MTTTEIRAAMRATFVSAEEIWNRNSPFPENSVWVGFLETQAQAEHMNAMLGPDPMVLEPADGDRYNEVKQFISDLLPSSGQDRLANEFSQGTIMANPSFPEWRPSHITITLATVQGAKIIYLSVLCGGG
jgi:hypothetical protein